MGKRSDFEKRKNDTYDTPLKAVDPLIPFLSNYKDFSEPCAGAYDLVKHLTSYGYKNVWASDIAPRNPNILPCDALSVPRTCSQIITNPPWTRELLHPMIEHFITVADYVWLLFDADWMHTTQNNMARRTGCKTVSELLEHCHLIVSIGRVKWIEGSKHTGKDNCCWYLFKPEKSPNGPVFIPRE